VKRICHNEIFLNDLWGIGTMGREKSLLNLHTCSLLVMTFGMVHCTEFSVVIFAIGIIHI